MSQQAEFANLDPTFPGRQQSLTQADFARLLRADPGNICRAFDVAGIDPSDDWRSQLAALWAYRAEQAAGRVGNGNSKLDLCEQRARLAKEQADKTNFELRRLRGEFVPLLLVRRLMDSQAVIVKTHLLATHNKIAGRFPALDKKVIVSIEDEIRDALTEVANLRLPPDLIRQFREWQENGNEPIHDDLSADSKVSRRTRAPAPKTIGRNSKPRSQSRDTKTQRDVQSVQTAAQNQV